MRKLLVIGMLVLALLMGVFGTSSLMAGNTYAVSLDGGESFGVNDDGSNHLDVSSAWTYEAWIKVSSFNSSNWECIMDRRTVFSFYLIPANSVGDFGVRFVARDGSGNIIADIQSDGLNGGDTEVQMDIDTWYHVAATFDGSTAKLYVNNSEADTDTGTDWGLTASSNALNLGGRYWGSYSRQMSNTDIDEIRMSNTARAIGDMQTSKSDAAYTSDDSTVLLMHLDDQGDPPTYESGTSLTGSKFDDAISSADYVSYGDLTLPVELISFTATSTVSNAIVLNWVTGSEIDNAGFVIERKSGNSAWQEIANFNENTELVGQGNTSLTTEYSYTDKTVEVGVKYDYRLADVSYSGKKEYYLIISDIQSAKIPTSFAVSAYPNPFNPSVTIKYELPNSGNLNMAIYDIKGNVVKNAISEWTEAGVGEYFWNATDNFGNNVSTGIYLYKLTIGNFTKTSKIVFMK